MYNFCIFTFLSTHQFLFSVFQQLTHLAIFHLQYSSRQSYTTLSPLHQSIYYNSYGIILPAFSGLHFGIYWRSLVHELSTLCQQGQGSSWWWPPGAWRGACLAGHPWVLQGCKATLWVITIHQTTGKLCSSHVFTIQASYPDWQWIDFNWNRFLIILTVYLLYLWYYFIHCVLYVVSLLESHSGERQWDINLIHKQIKLWRGGGCCFSKVLTN